MSARPDYDVLSLEENADRVAGHIVALEETITSERQKIAALEANITTLELHRDQLKKERKDLKAMARRLVRTIGKFDEGNFRMDFIDGNSKVGGGALPLCDLPTRILRLIPGKLSASRIEKLLRSYDPPIIVRVDDGNVLLDVRTIRIEDFKVVAEAIQELALIKE